MMIGLGGIGIIFMILFWGGLIFGGVWLAKTIFSSGQQTQSRRVAPQRSNALDILNQRYARGELTREEYDLMKQDLR
jgi:putative membrane protein